MYHFLMRVLAALDLEETQLLGGMPVLPASPSAVDPRLTPIPRAAFGDRVLSIIRQFQFLYLRRTELAEVFFGPMWAG